MPLRAVTEDYFKLLRLPIEQGRDFRSTDSGKAPGVAVVNQALADRYFPHASAVGKKLWLDGRNKASTEIVGVVANGRTDDLTRASNPEIYLPLWQARAFSKHLVVRTAADPRAMMASVQRELRAVNPTVAVENMKTLEQIRGDSLASRSFAMQLLAGFSAVGSVLTLVGIYGVLSLSVASRRRELAIRSAVGAQQRDIRNLIFAEGFRLIAGGVIAGTGRRAGPVARAQDFPFPGGSWRSGYINRCGSAILGRRARGMLGPHPSRGPSRPSGSAEIRVTPANSRY